jgi:hypothetical protein
MNSSSCGKEQVSRKKSSGCAGCHHSPPKGRFTRRVVMNDDEDTTFGVASPLQFRESIAALPCCRAARMMSYLIASTRSDSLAVRSALRILGAVLPSFLLFTHVYPVSLIMAQINNNNNNNTYRTAMSLIESTQQGAQLLSIYSFCAREVGSNQTMTHSESHLVITFFVAQTTSLKFGRGWPRSCISPEKNISGTLTIRLASFSSHHRFQL